ncbi:Hypothetical predicted protein [Paramuricea clavata]|uniref:Uncharacterized protein n=1 Tax=Paramuricea clavata TaxID=317549 RepID=A0A7D9DTG6_PARCT|nr:Hypothetical predicted protein [Paramuricea clavata]
MAFVKWLGYSNRFNSWIPAGVIKSKHRLVYEMEDAGDYDGIELEETRGSYPQYDDMDYHDLLSNFDELTIRSNTETKYGSDPLALTDINHEFQYVKKRMEERGTVHTSFIEGGEGTVNITGPTGSTTAPGDEFVEDPNGPSSKLKKFSKDRLTAEKKRDFENQVERVQAVTRVVQAKEKIVLNPRNKYVRELINRSSVKTLNDGTEMLMFRSERGINKSGTQIMKRGKTNVPTYSKNSPALKEYKELVRRIKEESTTSTQSHTNEAFEGDETTIVDRNAELDTVNDVDSMFEQIELIDVRVARDDIPGLTPQENKELRGVLNPTDAMDLESRIGKDGALENQVEYFQDTINKTMELGDETDDTEEFINLEERIVALREARDRTVMQKEL